MLPFDRSPFLVVWAMTLACDQACRSCRGRARTKPDPAELTFEEGKRLIDETKAMGAHVLLLTGGDPAKRPDLVDLVRYGSANGLYIALTPSPTPLVTDELLLDLGDAGLARVAISLDGATARTHDQCRGVEGSYERTLDILGACRRIGLTTQVNTTVTSVNVDELEHLAGALVPLGLELWSVYFPVPSGFASHLDIVDPKVVEQVLERLADLTEIVPFDIKTTAAPQFRRVLLQRKVAPNAIAGVSDKIGRAWRGVNDGQGLIYVSPTGEVFPSGQLPVSCGNVRKEKLSTIYRENPLMLALRDPERLKGRCGGCEFRSLCGGSRARAWAITGDPLEADPACAWIPVDPADREAAAHAGALGGASH